MVKLGSFENLQDHECAFVVVADDGTLGSAPDIVAVCTTPQEADKIGKSVKSNSFIGNRSVKVVKYPLDSTIYPFAPVNGCNPKVISTHKHGERS